LAVVGLHAYPDCVQKFAAVPSPPGAPAQQAWPAPPHVPQASFSVALHVPKAAPHDVPLPMHIPSTQQSLAVLHVLFWQHGCPVAPQAVAAPL
jgi:hypothetical protein